MRENHRPNVAIAVGATLAGVPARIKAGRNIGIHGRMMNIKKRCVVCISRASFGRRTTTAAWALAAEICSSRTTIEAANYIQIIEGTYCLSKAADGQMNSCVDILGRAITFRSLYASLRSLTALAGSDRSTHK